MADRLSPDDAAADGTVRHFSVLTCPECGHRSRERMPLNACQYYYDCTGCGALLKPKPGDCCVYCSYGDVPCPPVQQDDPCC